MWIKIIGVAVVVTVIAMLVYFVWFSGGSDGPGEGFVGGNGRIEATEIGISTKLAGRIISIHVDEGDYIKAGDVLAVMETNVLEAKLNEAKAQVFKARAAEASAKAQIKVQQSNLNAAKAILAQRQSELENARKSFKRSADLILTDAISEKEYDEDETNQATAGAIVETARAEIEVAEAMVEAAKADLRGATANIEAAEAMQASIAADIQDSHLIAPCDGRVQYKIAQAGEVLPAGGKVLNYIDLSDMYVNFFLPAADAGKVNIGSEVRIVLDALPQFPIPAKVTFIASNAQFTPKTVETESERQKLMFRVKATVDKELLLKYMEFTKTGLPGTVWVKLDPEMKWPESLDRLEYE